MPENVFLLSTDFTASCRGVIHSRNSGLRVQVFYLDREKFVPDSNEIQLYGDNGKERFAFETIGIEPEGALDVVDAIRWYAAYINCPDLEIMPEKPENNSNIAV